MTRRGFRLHFTLYAVAALMLAACGGGGGRAGAPATSPQAPTGSERSVTNLSISPGTLDLEAGRTGVLKATATFSDASTVDVTTSVGWSSSDPTRLAVDERGGIMALAAGEVVVTAAHSSGVNGSARIVILQSPETTPTPPPDGPAGFVSVDGEAWSETSVRKVLHVFAFGGLATDAQIRQWADMAPEAAITEMLTFTYNNEKLSPSQDATAQHATSLEELQKFWSGSAPDNPMRWDKRRAYPTLVTTPSGETFFISPENMQRAWIQAVLTRGVNPFVHRVAFFLSNYQLSLKATLAGQGLMRSYYDGMLADLVANRRLSELITNAARSAAVAARYEHRNNTFVASTGAFSGNDDFAREYFQLFFRLLGTTEDTHYHEETSIQNNARLLTGMQVSRVPNAYGSSAHGDWVMAPLRFTDHYDGEGFAVLNVSRHHADCLEVLRQTICGRTAEEKLSALRPHVAVHREALDGLPVYIVEHFADDQLTEEEIATIRAAWRAANDDLLAFLRSYAISTTFHHEGAVKFASAFTRNLTLSARTLMDNTESFLGQDADFPRRAMLTQGGVVFEPVHDVFGAQTGVEASISSGVFKSAFDTAIEDRAGLGLLAAEYTDADQTRQLRWVKDWRTAAPPRSGDAYVVRNVAEWLWERLQSDGGKNFDLIARSQVYAFLALGLDFGAAVTQLAPAVSSDPESLYSTTQLLNDERLRNLIESLASSRIALDSLDAGEREEANRRMNLAVGFMAMTPYTFAFEGR